MIGTDLEAEILSTADGAVVARLDDATWFINSSRDAYGRSLTEVGAARDALAAGESEARVDDLERRLRAIDPDALQRADSYWASIIEQIRLEQF